MIHNSITKVLVCHDHNVSNSAHARHILLTISVITVRCQDNQLIIGDAILKASGDISVVKLFSAHSETVRIIT